MGNRTEFFVVAVVLAMPWAYVAGVLVAALVR